MRAFHFLRKFSFYKLLVLLACLAALVGCRNLESYCTGLYPNARDGKSCQEDCQLHFPSSLYSDKAVQACNVGQYYFLQNIQEAIDDKKPIDSKELKVIKELSYRTCFDALKNKGCENIEACYKGVAVENIRFISTRSKTSSTSGDRETGN